MVNNILIGISYALSAGLQPGPLQAFFLAKVAENGWRRTLPAAFAPLISDGPIAVVSILLLNILSETFRNLLQLAGGFLLLYFAWVAFKNWREDQVVEIGDPESPPKTIFQAALINLLNPNPYLGWSLVMGPAVLAAWDISPGTAVTLLLAFYITMIGTSMMMIFLMGRALLLGPGARKVMNLISTILLVGLGFYFIYQAGGSLAGWLN